MKIEELKRQILAELAELDPADGLSFELIQKKLDEKMLELNHRARDGFEGYSPTDMDYILYDPLSKESPLRMKSLPEGSFQKIPIFNLIQYFLNKLAKEGEVKLTKKGNLPVKWVVDLHEQGFRTDYVVEIFDKEIRKEDDSRSIQLTKILVELAGWVRKRKGKMSLSKLGDRERKNPSRLLKKIWEIYTLEFNWGYFDRYALDIIGRLGFLFSLILVSRYGDIMRDTGFYAEKYYDALPLMMDDMVDIYGEYYGINNAYSCYEFRTFDHFMMDFGLISLKRPKRMTEDTLKIKKTPFFDEWIKILPSLTS